VVIGKALENWTPESNKKKIAVFVTTSWYDPDVYLTSTGDLVIEKEATSSALLAKYNLKDSLGEIIQRIGVFSEAVIANLKAGKIETEELISPLASIDQINTQRINLSEINSKPGENITINLQQEASGSSFGTLIIKGNASFSGELTTESLLVEKDATIAGTLYADEIITRHGKFGDLVASNVYQEEASDSGELTATDSANLFDEIDDIEALIAEILNTPINSDSEELPDDISIPNDLLVSNSLNIGGTLSLADNAVNTLFGPLYLQSLGLGGIDILAGKIVIDEHGNVIFSEDVTIKGDLFANTIKPINGQDLVIDLAQIPVAAEPGIELPPEASESAFGKLLVKGFDGKTVASIDASGNAFFSSLDIEADYSATQSGAIIAASENEEETGNYSPAIKTNATAGIGILPANKSEIMIYSKKISEKTLIYITPITDTENKVLYVKSKHAKEECLVEEPECISEGWFKVGVDMAIDNEIKFNWWIIN